MRNGTDRLRALNVPQRVQVELDACGLPSRTGVGPIEAVRETWRIVDEWWRDAITRMHYEVLLEVGQRAVLFVDHVTLEWFLQKPYRTRLPERSIEALAPLPHSALRIP